MREFKEIEVRTLKGMEIKLTSNVDKRNPLIHTYVIFSFKDKERKERIIRKIEKYKGFIGFFALGYVEGRKAFFALDSVELEKVKSYFKSMNEEERELEKKFIKVYLTFCKHGNREIQFYINTPHEKIIEKGINELLCCYSKEKAEQIVKEKIEVAINKWKEKMRKEKEASKRLEELKRIAKESNKDQYYYSYIEECDIHSKARKIEDCKIFVRVYVTPEGRFKYKKEHGIYEENELFNDREVEL